MIDHGRLVERFAGLQRQYREAEPFPHVVLDDVFPIDVLRAVAAEFTTPAAMSVQHDGPYELKSAESRWEAFGPATRALVAEANSGAFLRALEALTGIDDLIADAKLHGGGQHQIRTGGKLGIHADFSHHPANGLDRRLNLLVYLNEGWKPEWGGQLELWSPDMDRCVERVEPSLGTTVIFSTTATSFHGHPEPLACPEDVTRKSLAFYYFTNGRPDDERAGKHSTLFQVRPGSSTDRSASWRSNLRRFVPPIVIEKARGVRSR